MSDPVYDVFLSHSHHDAGWVEDLGRRLTERYGFKVWLDRWALVPGKSWQQDIARGLSETSTCAVCIGNHTPRGWFLQEIERALNTQAANDDYRVIPVLLPDARKDLTEVMPVFLELRTWADFRKKQDDEYALHVLAQGIRGEPVGPRARTPGDRKESKRRRTVSLSVIGGLGLTMAAVFLGIFLGASYGGTEDPPHSPPARLPEIGDPYPSSEEFLAQFMNQSSKKCISRNIIGVHDGAETPGTALRNGGKGADIYQYACSIGGIDFPQALVLTPLKNDNWMIHSSVKSNLCLQSDGKPGSWESEGRPDIGQRLQICQEGDDRQKWILQGVRNADSQIVLVRNRQSDLCLVHGGRPGGEPQYPSEAILQRECRPEAKVEWLIRRLPPFGLKECIDQQNTGIINHETGLYVNVGDGDRPRMGSQEKMISLTPEGQSPLGCTVQIMQIVGPSKKCMEVAESSSAAEVIWIPCNTGRSRQRWVVESRGKLDGRSWLRLRPIYDMSRCLQQSGTDVKTATLTAPGCQGDRFPEWATVE